MVMEILSKKLLILIEISTGNYTKLDQIAERIGVTKQAVSDYIKKMKNDGMITIVNGYYRATPKGINYIFEKIDEIEKYLNEKKKKLGIMESFSAIAGNDIKKGSKVGLFMRNGFLYAYQNKKSSCYAYAMENAKKGEDIALHKAEGIIDMKMGKIFVVMLPLPNEGGSKTVDYEKLRVLLSKLKIDKFASLDIIGKIVLEKIGIKSYFEFAPLQASINACERGLNILIAGSKNEAKHAISVIEEYNTSSMEEIDYKIIYKK
ncbi:MAG: winged helix-turn-helix transcriptional regulator [Thermoplasmata archaeon]|nr:MAG: winged helix-turn-helix transcriptional regulator [Thermoplasmata archaeon]